MALIIKKKDRGTFSISATEIEEKQVKAINSKLARKILRVIAEEPEYPVKIAKKLAVNEQKVYYHIRKLEKSKLIKIHKREDRHGAVANYYTLTDDSFFFKFKDFKQMQKISYAEKAKEEFLEPFVKDGKFDALVVVGSPDPHGKQKARSRDGHYAIDLALFLGTFLNYIPSMNVKLDTEVRAADLKKNLILIGGPVVNNITDKVNNHLPIHFDKEFKRNIKSSITKQVYLSDNCGMIVKMKNPLNERKSLLVIAGKRYQGTKAAVLGFLTAFDELIKGNKKNKKILARVVEGHDADSDGILDSVEFLE